MGENDQILTALGRIEGKLDAEIDLAREHREDDKRRFSAIDTVVAGLAEDINKAKGARGAIIWIAGLIAAVVGGLVTMAAKKLGLQ